MPETVLKRTKWGRLTPGVADRLPVALASRRQPLPQPTAVGLQGVAQAVVQAAFAALPELPVVGPQAVAAPVWLSLIHI